MRFEPKLQTAQITLCNSSHSMLRKVRTTLAIIFFLGATLLFLDFTGTIHKWLEWIAKIQFLPALLSVNIGVLAVLIVLTLVLGRVYCSVICPLGVMQDIFAKFGKMAKKNRYTFSPAMNIMRVVFLGVMVVAIIFGIGTVIALLAPYSAYGRIVQSLGAPIWLWGNNILAGIAERAESYAFYETEVWIRSFTVLGVAVVTLIVLAILAWRNGRTYCNTICPVGTVLGFLSKYSLYRPVIDTDKCNGCGLCARNCKASCIDSKSHNIDYSRCVDCLDCIYKCNKGAIKYKRFTKQIVAVGSPTVEVTPTGKEDISRRNFLTVSAFIAGGAAIKATAQKVDGGLAVIEEKKIPERKSHIVPPGAQSHRNLERHCTGCQLCVSVCPNHVLRPSDNISRAFQPVASYERGYCRPECTKCSEVCPTGAIRKIDTAEKSSIQIGRAQWLKANCIPLTDEVACGNCARHCPVGAIQMIPSVAGNEESLKIPAVNSEKCIGCGTCENLCPSRPFSAIYVEGNERHRIV